jgi:hypothetical protein
MAHFRKLYSEKYIGTYDLEGMDDLTVTIEDIGIETMRAQDGEDVEKPVVTMKGAKKKWVLAKTNAKAIAELYGNDTAEWLGKPVTLYVTQCQAFGETVDCIRVRTAKK